MIPGVKNHVAPYALERWMGGAKEGMVGLMIKYSPRFHIVNGAQLFTTLWPIADTKEIWQGLKMWHSPAGKEILAKYNVGLSSRTGSYLGPEESFNQGVAFMTMYNRGMKSGLTSAQAADYGILRGNIYSQFQALVTDRPLAFRKVDPTGAMTLFQRFSVKQAEQLMDLVRDKHISGAGKWLATVGLMGGTRALMFGTGGYLTYKMAEDIKKRFGPAGQTIADTLQYGLPGMAGIDISNTAMIYNPPFGDSIAERVGNAALGPMGSIATSVVGAAFDNKGIESSAARRTVNALVQRLPVLKEYDSIKRIIMDEYDIRSPNGALKYKLDVADMLKRSLGFRSTKEANLQLAVDAMLEVKKKRDDVLDYAASRYGQAKVSGVGLPKAMEEAIMKEVDGWNARWPDMTITGTDLWTRTKARMTSATKTAYERQLKQAGKVGRSSEFADFEP
jgi:hypothetical protein